MAVAGLLLLGLSSLLVPGSFQGPVLSGRPTTTTSSRPPSSSSSSSSSSSPWATQCLLDGSCFALFWALLPPRTFPEASRECLDGGGRLMSVGSREAAEALEGLFYRRGGPRRAWLGLRLSEGSRRDLGKRLRGFRWMSGEERTDYAAWAGAGGGGGEEGEGEEEEGPLCVVVTPGLLWEERPCQSPADGFLCEYSYPGGTCGPLLDSVEEGEGEQPVYETPFGARETDLLALPPGSTVHLPSLGLTLQCRPPRWVSNWGCSDLGCQQDCAVAVEGSPKCLCFEGFTPDPDKPHQCLMVCHQSQCPPRCQTPQECSCPEGYILDVRDEEGEGEGDESQVCTDIDECHSGYCEGLECLNEPGGYHCLCPDGGALVKDKALCGETSALEK